MPYIYNNCSQSCETLPSSEKMGCHNPRSKKGERDFSSTSSTEAKKAAKHPIIH